MRGVRVWSPAVVAALLLAALPVVSSQAARGVPQDGAAPAAARAVDDIVLRVAMQDDVKSLNPLVAGDVWTWNVLGYIYDTPMSTDLIDSSKFIPYIATHSSNCSASSLFNYDNRSEWEPLAKYGQITVHYDFTNVFFHDGHQMDIGDILFSFGVQATVTDWASSVKCLMDKGGDIGSNYSDTHWLAIKTMDSTTLRFYFQAPFADFIRNTLSVFILPQHIWANKAGGQSVDGTDPFLPPTNSYAWNPAKAIDYTNNPPVGSGPFKFVSWTPGQQAKIDTWREHFFPHQPFIDAIVFKIYKTAEQAVQALQMGDIDYIAWSIPPTYVPDLERDENIGLAMNAEKGFFYMGFNMRKKSFGYLDNDPEKGDYGKTFRQAVAHCVNKKEIVERILQNFGIPAVGPISEMDSEWYNESLEDYEFDPQKALDILAAGADGNPNTTADNYKLTNPSVDPGKGNWWLNPDGTPIGSGEGGRLEILTPPADYDPIHCQAPSMIATQMQSIGINAESVTLDFGTIVNRIDQRNFDMYLLGWRIGSDPSDFMHAFFHSSAAESGQNYPGYRNESYDALIDLARSTSDEYFLHKAKDYAQAAIVLDLPYNVLYFRTNIEAYRSDRFVNWTFGPSGSIFSWRSIMGIHPPSPFSLKGYLSVESPVPSESETDVVATVKDQDGLPAQGARVFLKCANGTFANGLTEYNSTTLANGQVRVKWKAPYVPGSVNDTKVGIQLLTATKDIDGPTEYDPAPSKVAVIKVMPEGAVFLRMRIEVETEVIDAGESTPITVTVRDQDGNPVEGATIETQLSEAGPSIDGDSVTNSVGIAVLVFHSPEILPECMDFRVDVFATHSEFSSSASGEFNIAVVAYGIPPLEEWEFPINIAISVCVISVVALAVAGFLRRKRAK